MSIWDQIEYFQPSEFNYPDEMDTVLLLGLDEVRREAGVPIYISSDYRPGDSGAHGEGKAVDIVDDLTHDAITSAWRFKIVRAAFLKGFTRIGVYDAHVHLDVSYLLPQGQLWTGTSS